MKILDIFKEITKVRYENLCSHEEAIKIIKEKDPEEIAFPPAGDNILLIDYINNIKNSVDKNTLYNCEVFLDDFDDYPNATLVIDSNFEITKEGLKKYRDALYTSISEVIHRSDNWDDVYINSLDLNEEEEFEKRYKDINDFLVAVAGYISDEDYQKYFGRDDENEEENIIEEVKNRYNISLDADFAGQFYEEISSALKNNRSIDEFNKLIENLSK